MTKHWQRFNPGIIRTVIMAVVLLSAALLLGPSVWAQDLQIQKLRIQVMPEFDDPRVLVIVQGRLNIDGQTPQRVSFRLPRGAQINQMATMDVNSGAVTSQPYETVDDETDPRWMLVSYTLDSAHFFYEYYDDGLGLGEANRQFSYLFNSLLPVSDLQVEIQEPLRATDFSLSPSPTLVYQDERFGLSHHQYTIGTLAPQTDLKIELHYTKADATPSVSRQQVTSMQSEPLALPTPTIAPAMPGTPHETPAPAAPRRWGYVIGGGAGIVGLAAFWWWRRRRKRSDAVVPVADAGSETITQDAFCRQCGAALRPDSRFCHICGQAVPPQNTERIIA